MIKTLTDKQTERIISNALKRFSFDRSAVNYFNGYMLNETPYYTVQAVYDYLRCTAETKHFYYEKMCDAFISHISRLKDIHTNSTVNFYHFCYVNRTDIISRINLDISTVVDYLIRMYQYYPISDYCVIISAVGTSAVNREISNLLYSNKRKYHNTDKGILKPIETDNSNREHLIDGYISVWDKLISVSSPKQKDIISLKKQGYKNSEIADILKCSKQAIDIQLKRLYDKYINA